MLLQLPNTIQMASDSYEGPISAAISLSAFSLTLSLINPTMALSFDRRQHASLQRHITRHTRQDALATQMCVLNRLPAAPDFFYSRTLDFDAERTITQHTF